MNRSTNKRNKVANVLANRAIMEAYMAGEEIEYRGSPSDRWSEGGDNLNFSSHPSCYRIKPKKPPLHDCHVSVFVICRHDDGEVFTRKTRKSANRLFHAQKKSGFNVTLKELNQTVKPNQD